MAIMFSHLVCPTGKNKCPVSGGTIATIFCFPKMSLVYLTTISPIEEHVKSGSLTKQTLIIEEFYWYDLSFFFHIGICLSTRYKNKFIENSDCAFLV